MGNSNNRLTVSCNSADSAYRGFNFGGANPNTIFKGNDMNRHYTGLYLNTGSPGNPTYIGIQPHQGNRWNMPSLSGLGGVNLAGVNWIQTSRFDVDSTLGVVYNPLATPSSWFQRKNGGNTFYCYSSTICSSLPPAFSDSTINVLIASGMFDSEEITDESRAIAAEYLYRELSNDSALLYSDSTYIQFLLDNQDAPVAYLYNAEEYMRAAYNYDTTLLALLDSVDVHIALFADSISNIYKWHEDNLYLDADSMLHVWTDKVNFLNQTINNINIQREGILTNNLENAVLQNDYVVDGEVPESNAAAINEAEALYIESGEDIEVLQNYYSTILFIAMQCPYTGGPAVERARSFVALLDDSVLYDDVNTCLQNGVYRFANDTTAEINYSDITIIPNPAVDKVTVQLTGIEDGICTIQIRNVINEIVYESEFNCAEKNHLIHLNNLSGGVYSIAVNAANKKSVNSKFIILR
jgi:hypothetical protein